MQSQWTKPYFGVSHLSVHGKKSRASISEVGNLTQAHLWYPGCGFSPLEELFGTRDAAKVRAESWLKYAA